MYTEASSKFNAFYNVLFLSFFSFFSFNIPKLAEYNYQHNQLLDHEPLLFVISQPRLYPFLPLRPRLCVLYIFFSNGHNMYNRERERRPMPDAPKQRKSSEHGQQPFSCGTPATGHYFCFQLYNIICDVRIILCRERCYMTVIAPSLVRV